MNELKYGSLKEAFQEYYKGAYKEELKELPEQVWDALDGCQVWEDLDYCYHDDGSKVDVDSLSEFFDNLYINDLCMDNAKEVDENEVFLLYVDGDNWAYYFK